MHVSPWTFISGLVYVGNVRAQCVIVYKKMLIKLGVNAKRYVAHSTQSGVFFLFFFFIRCCFTIPTKVTVAAAMNLKSVKKQSVKNANANGLSDVEACGEENIVACHTSNHILFFR